MEMQSSIITCYLLYTLIAQSQGGPPFSIECSHTFNLNLNLAQLLILNVSTDIRILNSYTSQILVNSPCCQNISFVSRGMSCSYCSQNGIKVCNITDEAIEIKSIQDKGCESRSTINLSCTSRRCPRRNDTEYTEVYRPGDDTGCFLEGKRYMCSKYGNWTEINCTSEALTSTRNPTNAILSTNGVHIDDSTTVHTGGMYTVTPDTSTLENNHYNTSTDDLDMLTTLETLNTTERSTLYYINSTMNGLDKSNETLSGNFDTKKAMKALYTFLIVLGVVLILVFILVCAFFVRKQKDKVSISHVDYPLEYWHDQEYIDNVVQKSFTMKSSYTINPMYDNKGCVKSRYKKKNESNYKKRRENATKDASDGGNETPRRSNAFRTHSNGSASNNTDHPRKTKHDYTDKYIATATGSNFYNYSPSQSQDVLKRTTDLDVSTEDEADRSCVPATHAGTSSFRPTERQKKPQSGHAIKGDPNDMWGEHSPDVDEEQLYSVSYKEHLRRSLEDWSAEESDA